MKAKLLITAALIFAFAFTSSAQCTTDTSKTLLADETWLTYSKTGAKITSYSESAFTDISLKFGDKFKRISILYKSDRHGPYKEYGIYLTQDVANDIRQWAKKNL